jgi:CRP-like cAMP-binding protein
MGEGRTLAKHDRNRIVFAQGDSADAVFYIQEGQVKVSILSRSGKEAVLAILGPGDFFGEGCLNDQLVRTVTATIMTECSILRLDKAAMLRVLHDEPSFSGWFIAYLLHRNSRIEEDLVDHMFNSSEKRLARTLLLLANFGKDGGPEAVIAPVSQETLAEMVGTTRSRVNFFMNKFRRLGFIHYYNGGIRIHTRLLGVVLRD